MTSLRSAGTLIVVTALAGLFAFASSGDGLSSGGKGRGISDSSQEVTFSGPVKPVVMRCPLTNGWIRKSFAPPKSLCGPGPGLDIFGTDSMVVSAGDGIVQAVFYIGDVKAIMIRNGRLFYTYSNLDTLFFKKGDTVKAGSILGFSQMKDVGFIISDDNGCFKYNIASKIDCRCLVVGYRLSSPADSSLEARALDKVYRLKEVQDKDRWIDSISRHRDRISLMIARRPTPATPCFRILAGYDHHDGGFEAYRDFYVNVKGLRVQAPKAVSADSTLSGPLHAL